MKGYKGFEPGLICRNKQYREGETYEEQEAVPCKSGMHFCKNPFDVLDYYPIVNNDGEFNEFAEVEALNDALTDDNKKYTTTKLKVGLKFDFKGFIKACVDFAIEKTRGSSGDSTKIGSSGDFTKIGSSGDSTKIGSSGDFTQIGSSGDFTKIGSSGDFTKIGSSGDSTKIGSSGDFTQIGSSGDFTQIGSSGDSTKIGSSGDFTQIGSSGDFTQIGSSGDSTKIGSSGDSTQIGSSGRYAVVMCAGRGSKAKAKKGSWITLAEWQIVDGKDIPVCVKTEQVDGERIKEDTFYKIEGGEFVECK